MSKRFQKFDSKQMTIFDHLNKLRSESVKKDDAGKFSCSDRLRSAIKNATKNSPLSVHQIAGEMSHLLNETITAEIIYTWTRQSDEANGRPGRHIPAQYLPAFCHVTHDSTPIEIMGELVGLFILPGPDALRAEIQKEDEIIREAKDRKRRRQLLIKELEG